MSDGAPLLLVIALGALLPHGAVLARDWPDVPLPEGAQGEWVSRHMVYNGLNMRASRFMVAAKADAVEAFYRQAWKGEVVRNTLGRKTILGRADGDHFITVELTAKGGGTQGQIGIMEMAKPKGTPGNVHRVAEQVEAYADVADAAGRAGARRIGVGSGHRATLRPPRAPAAAARRAPWPPGMP